MLSVLYKKSTYLTGMVSVQVQLGPVQHRPHLLPRSVARALMDKTIEFKIRRTIINTVFFLFYLSLRNVRVDFLCFSSKFYNSFYIVWEENKKILFFRDIM